jgi:hypothetical protein
MDKQVQYRYLSTHKGYFVKLNSNDGVVTLFIQEEIQFVPQRAPAYPSQKQWSQGLSEDVMTRRTAKYGTLL